jgi:nucleoside-diphosphate-sugar epimerase
MARSDEVAPPVLLLTGATGCVGSAVLRRLADSRVRVFALTRAGQLPVVAPNVEPITGTLADLPGLMKHLPPVDRCIHAAAAVHGSESDAERIFAINLDESVTLASALADHGSLRRFVFVSTIAAGGQGGEPDPTPYATSKAQAEKRLQEIGQERGFSVAVARLATVYGPQDRGNIAALFRAISRRRYLRIVPGRTRKTLVWSGTVAEALVAAADPAVDVPPLSVVADPAPYRLEEIEDALAEAAAVPRPPRIPRPGGWAMASVGSIAQALTGRRLPISLQRYRTLGRDVVVEPTFPSQILRAGESERPRLREAFRRSYALQDD